MPLQEGWGYLLAIMDWWSRYVIAWELSGLRDASLGVGVWRTAIEKMGRAPEIMNTDQGAEFCSQQWVSQIEASGAKVSQDGRGRALDNVMIERLWRTVKWEWLYLRDYADLRPARAGLAEFFDYYNHRRWHQGLGNQTPYGVMIDCPTQRSRGTRP